MKQPLALFLCLLLLAGCSGAASSFRDTSAGIDPARDTSMSGAADGGHTGETATDAPQLLETRLQEAELPYPLGAGFFLWADEAVAGDFSARLLGAVDEGGYRDGIFYELFGASLHVLWDEYTGAVRTQPNIHHMPSSGGPVTLAFTGDINLADDWENMVVFHAGSGSIEDFLSAPLLARMRDADILLVNNEFTFSDRGTPMEGKLYTFRAATGNVSILHGMGADLVSLANNHVYDYGRDAFLDTLDTLRGASIPYVGAGADIEEAMLPEYFIVNGLKIAYVAASRAEKYILTPEATASDPGVLRCYDDTLFLEALRAAAAQADIVIAYPHWGTENTHVLEDVQVELGHKLVDAGADFVVGAHPHVLQGIEFYNGRPIAYSLGNFWFNTDNADTALLEIVLHGPDDYEVRVQPCLQTSGYTSLLEQPEDRRYLFDLLERISEGITIDDDGRVHG